MNLGKDNSCPHRLDDGSFALSLSLFLFLPLPPSISPLPLFSPFLLSSFVLFYTIVLLYSPVISQGRPVFHHSPVSVFRHHKSLNIFPLIHHFSLSLSPFFFSFLSSFYFSFFLPLSQCSHGNNYRKLIGKVRVTTMSQKFHTRMDEFQFIAKKDDEKESG